MAFQRKSGGGAFATPTAVQYPYKNEFRGPNPVVWVRAKTISRQSSGAWAEVVSLNTGEPRVISIDKTRVAQSYNGGAEIVAPDSWQPNTYFRSRWTVTTNSPASHLRVYFRIIGATDGSQYWLDQGFWATTDIGGGQRRLIYSVDDTSPQGIGMMEGVFIAYTDGGGAYPPDASYQMGYHMAL
jgi:hypothetical protein